MKPYLGILTVSPKLHFKVNNEVREGSTWTTFVLNCCFAAGILLHCMPNPSLHTQSNVSFFIYYIHKKLKDVILAKEGGILSQKAQDRMMQRFLMACLQLESPSPRTSVGRKFCPIIVI